MTMELLVHHHYFLTLRNHLGRVGLKFVRDRL